ncbi:hypothetical protein N780_11660 [Pontibacillus chungwhensis BH030062]|uniref:Uncharacterized protein n=1 Tax=Pontibacillus chungwhensis BH030062 TaxID=1385513 RepID=A0A0A2V2K5_9BACI|nr:hypothetical protein N780_11660 [Pontibacillus chungwhensis BH030062]
MFGCGLFLGLYLLLKGIDFFKDYGMNIGNSPELQLFLIDVTNLLPLQQSPITGTILLVMGSIITVLSFVAFLRANHHDDYQNVDQNGK